MDPVYIALGTAILGLCGWIKYREGALGKVLAAKDAVIAQLTARVDALQEERIKFVERMLNDLKETRSASDDDEGGPNGA